MLKISQHIQPIQTTWSLSSQTTIKHYRHTKTIPYFTTPICSHTLPNDAIFQFGTNDVPVTHRVTLEDFLELRLLPAHVLDALLGLVDLLFQNALLVFQVLDLVLPVLATFGRCHSIPFTTLLTSSGLVIRYLSQRRNKTQGFGYSVSLDSLRSSSCLLASVI